MTKEASLSKLIKDRISLWGFLSGLLILGLFLAFLLLFAPLQSELIPLHYNVYFGIDFIGPGKGYFVAFGLGIIIWLINFILALWAIERELLATRLLAWFSAWLIALTLFASIITKWHLT